MAETDDAAASRRRAIDACRKRFGAAGMRFGEWR
jgi:hypothetical protein